TATSNLPPSASLETDDRAPQPALIVPMHARECLTSAGAPVSRPGTLNAVCRFARGRRPALGGLVLNALVGLLVALTCALQNTLAADGHWVTPRGCGPQLTEPGILPPVPLANTTLRQCVRTTIGGKHLRLRFSNAY